MHPKAKSNTTFWTSTTNKKSTSLDLQTPVQFVRGVGPKIAAVFEKRSIHTVWDLLHFFPRSYENRTDFIPISQLEHGEKQLIRGQIRSFRKVPLRNRRMSLFELRCEDASGSLLLKWFHAPQNLIKRFEVGKTLVAFGETKKNAFASEMIHPEVFFPDSGSQTQQKDFGGVIPIYVEIDGIPNRRLRSILRNAFDSLTTSVPDGLPESLKSRYQFPSKQKSMEEIHFPETSSKDAPTRIRDLLEFKTPHQLRLIYEEFFEFQWMVLRQRMEFRKERALTLDLSQLQSHLADLTQTLPFSLTSDQKKVIDEILSDFGRSFPMNRLVQGDVGSGKTAVALLTAGCLLAEGSQAALMAPTEILAEQHFLNVQKLFKGKLSAGLLTSSTPNPIRESLRARLSQGEPLLLIGTHALLEGDIEFKNLNYILIDEQHRFGVNQRRKLWEKGIHQKTLHPHLLVLTATPIPRTLALTFYGDLQISSIRELPPGRTPIKTFLVPESWKPRAYERIRKELQQGRQAYFIYPLVEESEAQGFEHLKAAVQEVDRLSQLYPDFKVELLHGQLKASEKAQIMQRFKENKTQILVSTTVVEVGVDVPNATVMAIEHSERFGLCQLHQLRGRVGRGTFESICFLFASWPLQDQTEKRLRIFENTNDGFAIAEADLSLRGPGEFLGTRQSGDLPFRIADLIRDQKWLVEARKDAAELLKEDPDLQKNENQGLKKVIQTFSAAKENLLQIS